jgi:hypothetical protein
MKRFKVNIGEALKFVQMFAVEVEERPLKMAQSKRIYNDMTQRSIDWRYLCSFENC